MNNDLRAAFMCIGGPLAGRALTLSINHPYTLEFSLKGFKGYYANPRDGGFRLTWTEVGK